MPVNPQKPIFNRIKMLNWYDWMKYIQAVIIFAIAFVWIGVAATISILSMILVGLTFAATMFSVGYLIIKNSKFAHGFVLFCCGWWLYYVVKFGRVFWDFPRFDDVIVLICAAISVLCLIYLFANPKIKMPQKNTTMISFSVLCFWAFLFGASIVVFGTMDDIEDVVRKECIENKISRGYPKAFARAYCAGPSFGCVEKIYEENCEPDIKCCFATIEEDKKWNYLDYDEQGNKITQRP